MRIPFPKPSSHVAGSKIDVWSLINGAAAEAESTLGRPIVNLGQGFFSYAPPKFAIEAAQKALENPALNQYAPTRGHPALLQQLSKSYGPLFNRELDPKQEILVTAGANEGMYAAFTAFLDKDDEVILIEPFFDQYISNIKLPGGKPVYVSLKPPSDAATKTSSANNWTLDFDQLEAAVTPRTKMLVLNTPHNPVGKVFSRGELEKIAAIAVKNNIIVVSDEVYDRLHYSEFTRIATLSPEIWNLTLTVASAGKTFAATGWRVGYIFGPSHLIGPTASANTRIVFTTNTPLQYAASQALAEGDKTGYYQETVDKFKDKIKRLTRVFDELDLPYSIPEGGYFVLVNFSKVKIPSDYVLPKSVVDRPRDFQLALWLIHTLGVVAIPPSEFTATEEAVPLLENYLRFAVCKDDKMLDDAVERLRGLQKYLK